MLFLDLTPAEVRHFDNFFPEFELTAAKVGIENPRTYFEVVFCSAVWINRQRSFNSRDTWVQGISGGQGSGKSTFAMLLGLVFEQVYGLRVVTLSLDDFYLTLSERKQLAKNVTPLLATRGVPGTHDVKLMNRVIADICARQKTRVPRFDKAIDDRESQLETIAPGVDVLIVEGWCLGATGYAQTDVDFRNPVNALERDEDTDCLWRDYVNGQLTGEEYQTLFQSFDALFYLAVPGWSAVLRWRSLQETRLVAANATSHENKTMDRSALERFIMFYERITRKMLVEMPTTADYTFNLNDDHEFISLNQNT